MQVFFQEIVKPSFANTTISSGDTIILVLTYLHDLERTAEFGPPLMEGRRMIESIR